MALTCITSETINLQLQSQGWGFLFVCLGIFLPNEYHINKACTTRVLQAAWLRGCSRTVVCLGMKCSIWEFSMGEDAVVPSKGEFFWAFQCCACNQKALSQQAQSS